MPEHTDFTSHISGIPCGIRVDYFHYQPPYLGSPHVCPSDIDYYGDYVVEFTVLDRKGHLAQWLARKLTPADTSRIEQEILTHSQDNY